MILWAILLVLFVLLVLRPLAQRQRERALAERLKNVHDPVEAMLVVDTAMRDSQREGSWMAKLRESYWFWLR